MQLHEQVVADRHRARRPGGEGAQLSAARVVEREHALVRPLALLDDAGVDQAIGLQALELAVELLRRRRPEVRRRDVEALGELVAGRLALEQGGQDRMS